MAVPNPNNKYLTNMAAGKTSTGGVANAGQMSWAKAQLAKIPDPNIGIKSVGTTTSQTTNSGTAGLEPVKTDPIPNPAATTTINPASTQAADYQAWKAKQDDLFAKLEGLSNSQFSYDPNTDPAYQAQRDLAKLRAGDANRATMETMNDRGLLQSTVTNSQLDQNNQRAEQEAAAYIPQYREQAYGQFRDRLSNAANLLGIASNRGDTAYERDYQTGRDATGDALNEAQLTGVYQSPEARQQIDALLELKRQAEAPEITAEQRAGLSKQADGIRSRLTTMGVDIAKLGANTNSSNANAAAGVQTLAAKNQEFNQGITMAELTGKLPDGTATTAEQQRKLQNEWMAADKTGVISPMLANLYGLKAGMPTRAAKEFAQQLAISQQNANTSAYSAQTSRDSLNWSKDPNNPDNIYKNAQIDSLKKELSGGSKELQSELDGLYTGLTSGQIDPNSAISEINGRQSMGFITPEDATKMKAFVQKYLEGGSSTPKPQTVDNKLLQMTPEQLLSAWKTDPSGKAAGRSQYDWRSWVTDPNGLKAGLTYELWKSKYGPTLGG